MSNTESLQFIVPELILVFFSFLVLMGSVFRWRGNLLSHGALAFLGVGISLLSFQNQPLAPSLFFGLLTGDSFAVFFRGLILLTMGIVILFSMGFPKVGEENEGEYYFFLLILAVSMMLAAASQNLLMIYLTVEAVSIVSYILAGYFKREMFSSEAGIKYFIFGAVSTGIMLYGISLLYGLFGTLDLPGIIHSFKTVPVNAGALLLASLFVLVGFGFKCSLAPFHMWTPDVYEGAPAPVAALFSVGPKAVGFALILRVFVFGLHSSTFPWTALAGALAILTMTIGNLTALRQSSIKRLLACSTIAHAGYILVGLSLATPQGNTAALFYLFVYMLMNLGAFGAVILISNSLKSDRLEDYAGLYKRDPTTAVILAVSLLSLAGIPPLAGFLAKFFVLAAAVEKGFFILAIAMVINSVIACYYYVRVIRSMFLCEPQKDYSVMPAFILKFTSILLVLTTVILGIWPHGLIFWLGRV